MSDTSVRQTDVTPVRVTEPRSQVPAGVGAIGAEPVRLSWRIEPAEAGSEQQAYEVEASGSASFTSVSATSGVVEDHRQVGVRAPGGALRSREVRWYRVRVRTSRGWTDWGPTVRVEAGLLAASDWSAQAITLPDDPGRSEQAPSPILRTLFEAPPDLVRAVLYVTSLGVHEVHINGEPVGDALLAPGWTPYHERLLFETHDVTAFVRAGTNVVVGTLADGWYRGRLGWDEVRGRCTYGQEVGLLAQLELIRADGSVERVVTDGGWRAGTGEVRQADLYDGCTMDLRLRDPGIHAVAFDDSGWVPAAIVPLDLGVLEPRVAPPVRRVEVLPVRAEGGAEGTVGLDGGQNIAGFVRLRVRGASGIEVTVRHAEVLEPSGRLHVKALRSAKATDRYILADDTEVTLEPRFTFHGFRYAEVSTQAEVLGAEYVAISSDTPRRGWFDCSDARLVRLHDNALWSQRDNFVSVPTDCPQRDERLGWTGDAQAFAPTACTLFDSEAFWSSWLRDLALEQDDVLGVPSVVPNVVLSGSPTMGRAGWADAATIVPWAVYESCGDPAVLAAQLPSMRRWVDSLERRTGPDGLLADVGWQFGDWLDPDAPAHRPWEAKVDAEFLANAFASWSARLAGQAAALLGDAEWSDRALSYAERAAAATWERWRAHVTTTQSGCAVALRFLIVPADERAAVGDRLAELVHAADGSVSTGFLGTPLVLPALADAGRFDAAYRMLLRRDMPSWLYQVDKGATTIWERWDAILPDGSIHSGAMTSPPDIPDPEGREPHMLSFNHYAYGAVVDWLYRHVAGLAPVLDHPGYRRVRVAPMPVRGLRHASAAVDSAYGRVSTAWRLDDAGTFHLELELPAGSTADVELPASATSVVLVDGSASPAHVALGPGRHRASVRDPRIIEPKPAD
ncbi:MAG: family 78 glycoside hydrolase catalytic domain [Candidatus Limnocylindrales bacterium]